MFHVFSLLVEIVLVFALSAALLHKYGDWKRQNAMIIFVVLISWYFSLLTVFVLPLDISSTVYRQCIQANVSTSSNETSFKDPTSCKEPWSYIPDHVFQRLWRIVYWTSQFLTWILLPLMQSYARAGDFTFYEKLKSSLKDNILYYGSYLFLCLICLFYILLYTDIPLDGSKLRGIASSASNTWGLFLLIILLGYALVDVPRKLWTLGNPQLCLLRSYFQVSKLTSDFYDAEAELKNLIQRIYLTESRLSENDPLKYYMEKICSIIPSQFQKNNLRTSGSSSVNSPLSKELLVQYHKQLKSAIHNYKKTLIQRERKFDQVFELQKIVSVRKEEFHSYKEYLFQGPLQRPDKYKLFFVDYLWNGISRPLSMKIFSVISIVLSAAVVWSEALFFKEDPVLSVFALIIRGAKHNYSYVLIEIFCIFFLAYLCYCAYSTVFMIRIFNYYHFAPDHQTDENSLLFSGMLLSRLTPPLCLNFLGLIHMDSHIIKSHILETQYTQIMGHMDVISIISDGFNIYFPIVMIIISTATYFNVGSRLLSLIGFPQYFADDEITEDIVTEGQRLAIAEKDRRLRRGLLAKNEAAESSYRNDNTNRRSRREPFDDASAASSSYTNRFELNLPSPSQREVFPSKNIFDDI